MGNFDKTGKGDIPSVDTSAKGDGDFHQQVRQLAFSQTSDRQTGRTHISDGTSEKKFALDMRRWQREYMGVESGHDPQTLESTGKPMASSETLMRAEAHMVYAALNGDAKSKELAAVSLKNEKYDPSSEESVYQAYLSSQRKHEHVGATASAAQIETARIHRAYVEDKKHGTAIDFN